MKRVTLVMIQMCAFARTTSAGEFFRSAEPVPGRYLVRLKENLGRSSAAIANQLANEHRGSVMHVHSRVFQGFAFEGTEAAARALAHNPNVVYVREAAYGHLTSAQAPAGSSGLDRIDQRTLPLDNSYTYNETGAGTKIYIIDTGVNNVPELAGRIVGNASFVPNEAWTNDCYNHGTFVATIAAGSVHGVAKGASIVNYRVTTCAGVLTSDSVVSAFASRVQLRGATPCTLMPAQTRRRAVSAAMRPVVSK